MEMEGGCDWRRVKADQIRLKKCRISEIINNISSI
jgi:hypothetical protein